MVVVARWARLLLDSSQWFWLEVASVTTVHCFVIHIGDLGVSGTMQANVVVVPTPWVYTVRLWAVVPCIADLGGA